MGITYFKRYRMQIDLTDVVRRNVPPLAEGYRLVAWSEPLWAKHAEVKFLSFQYELDAHVFPCLGNRDGCRRLMQDICSRWNFVPQATWLAEHYDPHHGWQPCGTVQGIADGQECGAIQNLGVTPAHRGRGLGTRLLFEALCGFWQAGLKEAYLEVTVQNTGAVRLYERFGFRPVRTLYRVADVATVG
ncbi:MAG: N-acetyltransferase [Pirellulaceae bacterium]|nr:MAG: N-acetyltransferase [Pirellulaceae bacterium]